jgi:hypothetical protein
MTLGRRLGVALALSVLVVAVRAVRANGQWCAADADCGDDGACPAGHCVFGAEAAAAKKAEAEGIRRHEDREARETAALAPARTRSWYGYQIILMDLFWPGLAAPAFRSGYAVAAVWMLDGPFIHLLHHKSYGTLLASLGAGSLMPLGAWIGVEASCPHGGGWFCGLGGGLLGASIGMVVGWTIDAGVLAWEDDDAASAAEALPASTVSVFPSLTILPHGFGASVTAAF